MDTKQDLFRFIDKEKPVLEIGPLDVPMVTKSGGNVYYADIRSNEELTEHYRNVHNDEKVKKIVPIDFVVKSTYKEAVGGLRFQTVVSSHVIEHTFDFIRHLQEIGEILNESGHYVMRVPDKRHCFDHFREITPFRDAYDVYMNGESALKRLKMDYFMMKHPCNNPVGYLRGSVSYGTELFNEERFNLAQNQFRDFVKDSDPVHFWVFTSLSFMALIRDCLLFNLIPFELVFAHDSANLPVEFYVVLKKNSELTKNEVKRKAEIFRINEIIESRKSENKNFDVKQSNLKNYVSGAEKVYIYGGAEKVKYLLHILGEDAKYITGAVFEPYCKKEGCCVQGYRLDEIEDKNSKIIVALAESVCSKALQELKDSGFVNIATYLPLCF